MKDQDMQDQSMVPSSSKMTTIDVILRMVHDSSKEGIVTELHDNAASALTNRTPNGEQAWIMQRVNEVLQDKVLWSALWAASADINDSDDEDWTSTGVVASLSAPILLTLLLRITNSPGVSIAGTVS
jgi:Mg/Co/Ni transporter MgtE